MCPFHVVTLPLPAQKCSCNISEKELHPVLEQNYVRSQRLEEHLQPFSVWHIHWRTKLVVSVMRPMAMEPKPPNCPVHLTPPSKRPPCPVRSTVCGPADPEELKGVYNSSSQTLNMQWKKLIANAPSHPFPILTSGCCLQFPANRLPSIPQFMASPIWIVECLIWFQMESGNLC